MAWQRTCSKNACARGLANSCGNHRLLSMSNTFCQTGLSRRTLKSFGRPCARAGGGGAIRVKTYPAGHSRASAARACRMPSQTCIADAKAPS
eukprot:420697-Pyramimonas_sp.AAC.1